MRVRWPDEKLLLQNRIQNTVPLLTLLFITGSLAARVTTPRNITVLPGNPVTLTCDLDGKAEIIQVEWNRCDGRKVLVFHRDHGASFTVGYHERISVETSSRFTLLEMRANDSGEYCCELSTFPHGTLKGKLTLNLQVVTPQVPSSSLLIASIVGGILAIAVLGGIIALLVLCQVKLQAEETAEKKFDNFNAKSFTSQVVQGTNFFIKVHVGGDEYVHLCVHRPLPCDNKPLKLLRLQTSKADHEKIGFF
ncbi:hypothetical protein SKAU_G00264680 [Synaphobranchus kaupii]|uniref:Cystatin-B n=1 Tax=Synaphobranchus kaupii TaxID=118154 RepID=A0A9Q1IQ12_SYNKA|nr:hypothetical protein SKAU_G00264680 [Synaphobranchus kaupii]